MNFGTTLAGRSQWPGDLSLGSAAALLPGLRIRITPGALMSVCCQVEDSVSS